MSLPWESIVTIACRFFFSMLSTHKLDLWLGLETMGCGPIFGNIWWRFWAENSKCHKVGRLVISKLIYCYQDHLPKFLKASFLVPHRLLAHMDMSYFEMKSQYSLYGAHSVADSITDKLNQYKNSFPPGVTVNYIVSMISDFLREWILLW